MTTARWMLLGIVGIAFLLRIVAVWQYPQFNSDEVLYGAEALSVLHTGTDTRESGHPPLYLRGLSDAFDNRTSVLYLYLTIPFLAVLGPTVAAERLPAVLIGTAIVWLVAAVAERLTRRSAAGVVAGLFAALLPPLIFYSRTGQEFIVLPFLQTLLVWSFLKARERPSWYALAPAVVALGFYSYQPLKLMGPLLFLVLLFYERARIMRAWRPLVAGLGLAAAIALPSVWLHVTKWEIMQREFGLLSIFQYRAWPTLFVRNYAIHFTGAFWPYTLLVLPALALLGAWVAVRKFRDRILLTWFLLAPLAGAVTVQQGNRYVYHHRSGGLWMAIVLLASVGTLWLWDRVRTRSFGKPAAAFAAFVIILPLSLLYFFSMTGAFTVAYDRPFAEAVRYVSQPSLRDREVVVTLHHDPGLFHGLHTIFFARDPSLFTAEKEWASWFHPYWNAKQDFLIRLGRFRYCDLRACFVPHDGKLYIAGAKELPDLPRLPLPAMGRYPEQFRYVVIDNQ